MGEHTHIRSQLSLFCHKDTSADHLTKNNLEK